MVKSTINEICPVPSVWRIQRLGEVCIIIELRENEDEQIIKYIKKCSLTERPSGDNGFINKLENLLGRRLGTLPWGRPRKTEKTIK